MCRTAITRIIPAIRTRKGIWWWRFTEFSGGSEDSRANLSS